MQGLRAAKANQMARWRDAQRPLVCGRSVFHFAQTLSSRSLTLLKNPNSSKSSILVAIGPQMRILINSPMYVILLVLAGSSPLFAQAGGGSLTKPQDQLSVLNANQIIELSVAAAERNLNARDHYTYMERDEDRRLDSRGLVKSNDTEVTKMAVVNGARLEQLVEHNGNPPSAEDQRRNAEDREKLKHETSEERTVRLGEAGKNRSYLRDAVEAFDFQLVGEDIVEGRPTYVLQATPHPGYRAHSKYGKVFSKVEGKLWIDKQTFGCVKVNGEVTQAFSMGLFVARVQSGSHIFLDEVYVGDDTWAPKRIEVRANARILFLKTLDIDRILTYSDYRLVTDEDYSMER